jgi:hypothetical protein
MAPSRLWPAPPLCCPLSKPGSCQGLRHPCVSGEAYLPLVVDDAYTAQMPHGQPGLPPRTPRTWASRVASEPPAIHPAHTGQKGTRASVPPGQTFLLHRHTHPLFVEKKTLSKGKKMTTIGPRCDRSNKIANTNTPIGNRTLGNRALGR